MDGAPVGLFRYFSIMYANVITGRETETKHRYGYQLSILIYSYCYYITIIIIITPQTTAQQQHGLAREACQTTIAVGQRRIPGT